GLYGDVVEELDASVGVLVSTLRRKGILNNTLILFTSDNGPFFEGSVAGLKGGKGNSWEGAYRVPFVVSWPDGIANRGSVDAIASNIDVLPTLAEILGVSPRAQDLDGHSLLANFNGSTKSPHQYLYYFNNEAIVGVRNQRWKYLTHAYYRKSLGAFEKFDVLDGFDGAYELLFEVAGADGEAYSLADRHPNVLRAMKKELQAARKRFDKYRIRGPDRTFPD
ncbi:MAG: sulfatase-like hydrolase/transferase, partial [Pseudomonadales bacterium]